MAMRNGQSASARAFTQLSPLVLHAPAASPPAKKEAGTLTNDEPELVVLFGWMDGKMKHLAKYAAGYAKVFPSSPVLLVRSTGRQFLKSAKHQIADLAKATEFLNERGLLSTGAGGKPRRMVVHAFSNGGVAQMMAVARQARPGGATDVTVKQGAALAPAAVILDSCPGSSSLRVMLTAFTMPFRSRLARWSLYPLVAFIYLFGSLKRYLPCLVLRPPRPPAIENFANMLQDPSMLSPSSRRTYIYSREDPLIPYGAVEEHARRAKENKVDAKTELFKGSSHVAHEKADPERYWRIVLESWRASS